MAIIQAQLRNGTGKGVARKLRLEARVPAVLYGSGQPPQNLSIDRKEFMKLLETVGGKLKTHAQDMDIAGNGSVQILLKDFQKDPVTDLPVHVDFMRFDPERRLHMMVPIHVTGELESPGIKRGGQLQITQRLVEVQCRAGAIPDFLEVSVAALDIGGSVHIRQLKPPTGVMLRGDPNATLVAVAGAKVEEIAPVAAAAAPVKGKGGKAAAPPAAAKAAAAPAAKAAAPAAKAAAPAKGGGKK